MMVRPKKKYGQHFLGDENIARKIVTAIDSGFEGNVLEIGPGTGVLTKYLKERFSHLYAFEIDAEAFLFMKEAFPQLEGKIRNEDFLKADLKELSKEELIVVGNFPYNISSQIFFRILEHRGNISQVVGMIQKEVAERIAAGPGSKTYGILSVLLQAYYSIEYLFTVNPSVFIPPPKVKSAVIRLKRKEKKHLDCDEALFFRLVKLSFNQRRKTLRNSLKSILLNLNTEEELFSKRPEQLSVKDFVELTNLVSLKKNTNL